MNTLHIIAPDRRTHSEAIFDLIGKCFSTPGYFRQRDSMRHGRIGPSHYDWSTARIGLLDGQLVTHCGVWDLQMRIGTARVRVANVGMVATHADYRRRGFQRQAIEAAFAAMQDVGYDLTYLSGVDSFYGHFGYVRAWPGWCYFVDTDDLPAEAPIQVARKFTVRHREDLAELYNEQYAMVTGTMVRPTYHRCKFPDLYQGYLWSDSSGRVAGYLVWENRGSILAILDSAGDPEQIVRVVGVIARRQRCSRAEFIFLAPQSTLARHLRRGNCLVETIYRKDGRALIRTISLSRTLEKLSVELTRRLKASHLADWTGDLLVEDAREQVVLEIVDARVRVAPFRQTSHTIRGGEAVAQLLIGTDDPDEIVASASFQLTGDAQRLLPVLFPNQNPQPSLVDLA